MAREHYLVRTHVPQVHVQTGAWWRYLVVDPLIPGFHWFDPNRQYSTFAFEPHQAHLFSARDAVEAAVKLEAELAAIWGTDASVRVEVIRAG